MWLHVGAYGHIGPMNGPMSSGGRAGPRHSDPDRGTRTWGPGDSDRGSKPGDPDPGTWARLPRTWGPGTRRGIQPQGAFPHLACRTMPDIMWKYM